mgnify:CR=1 FL=1
MQKYNTILIATFLFFLLINTAQLWEGKIGFFAIPTILLMAIYFFILIIVFIFQLYKGLKEKFQLKKRLRLLGFLFFTLSTTLIFPSGLINYERFESKSILIAQREGAANCMTTLKLRENNTFTEKVYCFGITEINGEYTRSGDTVFFKTTSPKRQGDEFYEYAIIKNENNNLFNFGCYMNSTDSIGNWLTIIKNELDSLQEVKPKYLDPYDSLQQVIIDTTTLAGKREYIMNHFIIDNSPSSEDYDTLLDMNYDGIEDYVIGYYGQMGTGIKNRIKVYLFDKISKCYKLDAQLSGLSNPTFYLEQKKMTAFYIGQGAGSGCKLEWINEQWITTKTFIVDSHNKNIIWNINYPLKDKTEELFLPYNMIPPAEVLETNIEY